MSDEPALCPSAPATPGALLIGVVEETRRVANLATPIPVDDGFVEAARAHGSPERRFRFSIPCVEGRCGHWTGSACGLIGISRGQAVAAGLAGTCLGRMHGQAAALRDPAALPVVAAGRCGGLQGLRVRGL